MSLMGGLSERLAFLIDVNGQGAIRGFQQIGDEAERNLGRADDRLDRIGTRATQVGAGMLAFAGVAGGALVSFARASEEAQLSEIQLQNTLNNMPKLAGETAGSFTDLAAAIQDKTAADGDQIVSAIAMLGTFNQTGEQIRGVTPLVVDYARKFGVDLTSAAVQVGKALDGSIGALKRNGVTIDENLFKTDRYAAVTQALRDQVGGFAEREGQTFSGRLQRLKNELGDIQEGVGVGVVSAFESALGPVQALSDKFSDLSPGSQELVGKLLAIGTAGIGTVGALSLVAGQLIKLRDRFTEVDAAGSRSLTTFGKIAGAATAAVAVGGLALALKDITDKVGDLTVNVEAFSRATNDEMIRAFEGLQFAAGYYGDAQDEANGRLEAFGKIAEGDIGTAQRLRDALVDSGESVEDLDKILRDEAEAQAQANRDAEAGVAVVAEYGDTVEDTTDSLQGLLDATLAQISADLAYQQQVNRTEDALADYNEKAEAAIDAKGQDAEANEALERATLDAAEAILSQAAASSRAAEQQATLAGRTFTAGQRAQVQREELQRVAETLAPGSPLRARLDAYIWQLSSIPATVSTTIEQTFVSRGTPGSGPPVVRRHQGGAITADLPSVPGLAADERPAVLQVGETVLPRGARAAAAGGRGVVLAAGAVQISVELPEASKALARWSVEDAVAAGLQRAMFLAGA